MQKQIWRRLVTVEMLSVSLWTLLVLATTPYGFAAQPASVQKSDNVTNYSAGSKEDLSRLAGQMLDHTNQARAAMKQGDYEAAIKDVKEAQSALAQIQDRGHGATMIPIYREFVSISILRPVQAEQTGKQKGQAQGKRPAVVHEVAGDYTRALVSTEVAEKGLRAAIEALGNRNWRGADAALAEVQDGVRIEAVEADMPLSRARENLILARAAARQGRFAEAKSALKAAATSLKAYASAHEAHRADATTLERQIDEYADSIEKNHDQAIAKINSWWNLTSDWSPYGTPHTARK